MQKKKSGLENLILISQLGLNVMTPVFLCLLLGLWVERSFGIAAVLPFTLLGIVSGAYGTYRVLKERMDREQKAEQEEIEKQREDWEKRYGTGDGAGRNKRKSW